MSSVSFLIRCSVGYHPVWLLICNYSAYQKIIWHITNFAQSDRVLRIPYCVTYAIRSTQYVCRKQIDCTLYSYTNFSPQRHRGAENLKFLSFGSDFRRKLQLTPHNRLSNLIFLCVSAPLWFNFRNCSGGQTLQQIWKKTDIFVQRVITRIMSVKRDVIRFILNPL